MNGEISKFDTVVVGGGLAGLTAAAMLSKNGKKVALYEKVKLGGRAMTTGIKGFQFNFGAHAIYARDVSVLHKIEKSLGLKIDWADFSQDKAKYQYKGELTDIPATLKGIITTNLLDGIDKSGFLHFILMTMLGLYKGDPQLTIKEWLDQKQITQGVQKVILTLISSNFFTSEPEIVKSDIILSYYKSLFKTKKAVSYVKGGWQKIIDELERVIVENNGEIFTKQKIEKVVTEGNKVVAIEVGEARVEADNFVFCVPPSELAKIFGGTELQSKFDEQSKFEPTYIMFYDIGLQKRIESPYTYIYDTDNRCFLTDISYYDASCAPVGGQLIQAVSYLKSEELGNAEIIEMKQKQMEALFDKYFDGWREELVMPKMSKKAVVQETKWKGEVKGMPTSLPELENAYFAGDWCFGKGQLSELSFSTAHEVSKAILRKS